MSALLQPPTGWRLLSSQDASASTSISFTSLITAAYRNYKFVVDFLQISALTAISGIDMSTDNGSTWQTGIMFQHMSKLTNGSASYAADIGYTDQIKLHNSAANGLAYSGEITIFDPLAITRKNFITHGAFYEANTGATLNLGGGVANTGTAINAFRFRPDSGNFSSGTIKLYGIVG